jgi:hypothetical protein
MNKEQQDEWLSNMQTFIETAVESEQSEPTPFKLETELRIDFVMTKLKEFVAAASSNS